MGGRSVIANVLALPTPLRRLVVLGFCLLTIPLGSLAILLTPPGSSSAAWWPAASAAVLALACSRGNRIPAAVGIIAVGVLANVAAGRPLAVSLGFGLANGVEAWLVWRLASDRHGLLRVGSIARGVRFVLASLAGAAGIGLLAGATVAASGGDFATSLWSIAASHASAVLVIVPLFLKPLSAFRTPPSLEMLLQHLALIGVIAFVFWPDQSYPFAFLPLPILVWAAFRFRSGTILIQSLAVAIATTVLTILGGGPFEAAADADPRLALHALQAFIIVVAATGLVISEGRNERERLIAGVAAREAVLRSGILASTIGILVLEGRTGGRLRRAAFNSGAALLFSTDEWEPGQVFSAGDVPEAIAEPFDEVISGRAATWSGSVTTESGHTLQVRLSRVDDSASGFVLTVEIEDATARHLAAIADANALENEKATVDRLTDLNRQKDDFVAAVSHELRTPVTSILGFSDELIELDLDNTARGFVTTINRNVHRLAALIEDLLQVATTSADSRPAAEAVDVDEVLANVREDLSTRASAKQVALVVPADSNGGELVTVRAEFERILSNLMSNAVKFTPSGGTVTLSAERTDTQVRVRVVDTGVGIPAEDLENVFTRFFRSKSTELMPGTGLGLPITKALVEGLGGEITLTSDGSSGTEVLVELPLHRPAVDPTLSD